MSNVVGQLVVKLRAEIAEFTSDMGKANQVAQQTSAQINRQIRADSKEARGSIMLLGDEFGIHLPREMRTALAGMDGFREVAAAALGPVLILGFASVLTEKVIPAIENGAAAWAGWTKEAQDAYKSLLAENTQQIEFNKQLLQLQREIALVGKDAVTAAQMKAQWAQQDKDLSASTLLSAQKAVTALREQQDAVDGTIKAISTGSAEGFLSILAGKYLNLGPFEEVKKLPTEIANAQKEADKAANESRKSALELTKATLDLGEAQKTANAENIAALQKQVQLLDQAKVRLLQMQLASAADPDSQARIKNQLALANLKLLSDRTGIADMPDTVSAEFAKNSRAAADAWAQLSLDATKAIADITKANEKGLLGGVALNTNPSLPGFAHNPQQAELDFLNSQQGAIERGKLMDDMFIQTRTHAETYAFELTKLNAIYAGHKDSDEYRRAVQAIKNQYDENTIAVRSFATAAGQAFQNAIFQTHDFKAALVSVLEQLALLIPKLLLMKSIEGMQAEGGSTGFFGSLLGGLLGIGHADGGPVSAGKMYPVGEKGPELFMPGTSGTVVPNSNLGGSGAMSVYNDFRGVDAATIPYVERRVQQGVEAAIRGSLAKQADMRRRS